MLKRVISNSFLYGALPQLPKVASFFILPLITPFLTGEDYGVVALLSAYIGLISVLQSLGLNLIVVNAYYHYPMQYKWLWRQVFGFLLLWTVLYVCLLAGLIWFSLPQLSATERGWIILLKIVPVLLFNGSEIIGVTYFRLQHKALPIAVRAVLAGSITVFLNYIFIAEFQLGYMGWLWAEAIALVVNGSLFLYPVLFTWKFTPIFNFKWRTIIKSLRVCLPTVPHYYSTYLLNSSDRMIMQHVGVSTTDIGRYSLAYNLGNYLEIVSQSITTALGPNLNELVKSDRWREYRDLIFYFQAVMLTGCFTVAVWVNDWLPVLIKNKELANIQFLLIVIIMSFAYRPMYAGVNMVIFYYEKTKVLWKITFVAGLANVIANIIFIPLYGLEAAALITFLSFLYVGFIGFLFNHYKQLVQTRLSPVLWLLLIITSLVIVLFVYKLSIPLKALINVVYITTIGLITYVKTR